MADVGRPTKFKEEYIEQAYNYCLLGAIDDQLAAFFNVHVSTIHEWKHDYPSFSDAIKKGKEIADLEVTKSLKKRATGMRLKKQIIKDGEIFELEDEIAPDPTSMIFWLKNRQPTLWRDKRDTELSGNITTTSVTELMSEITDEDL